MPDPPSALRRIPKIDRILAEPAIEALVETAGRAVVLEAVRRSTEALRERLRSGGEPGENGKLLAQVCADVARRVAEESRPTLRRAINATGVVLHTGLGRAVLPHPAAQAVYRTALGHSLLEVDPSTGERGSRLDHVRGLLRELTGAEDALVVNNNAAAVFLAVSALAAGREVIISRGQLVEIGGSFRIPDVIRSSGARLVEVGTTNKVRLSDYAAAITPDTALLLRVHPSNFRIVGFTEEPSLAELTALGKERGIPVMDDLGSGALADLAAYGVGEEPTVHESVRAGADVITFSGDKLLGGPQAGLVIGSAERLAAMKRHPLMRVLRVDKLTLAALEATLRLYRNEPDALRSIPTLAALTASPEDLHARAGRLAALLDGLPLEISLESGRSQVGGGSLPGEELPTTLVVLRSHEIEAGELARRLRLHEPSIWGRVRKGAVLLDARTISETEFDEIRDGLKRCLGDVGEA